MPNYVEQVEEIVEESWTTRDAAKKVFSLYTDAIGEMSLRVLKIFMNKDKVAPDYNFLVFRSNDHELQYNRTMTIFLAMCANYQMRLALWSVVSLAALLSFLSGLIFPIVKLVSFGLYLWMTWHAVLDRAPEQAIIDGMKQSLEYLDRYNTYLDSLPDNTSKRAENANP